MFGVLPSAIMKLPMSEFRTLRRYYLQVREQMENADTGSSYAPTDGLVLE